MNRNGRGVGDQIEIRVDVRNQHRLTSRKAHRSSTGKKPASERKLDVIGVVQIGDQDFIRAGDIDRNVENLGRTGSDRLGLGTHIGPNHCRGLGVSHTREVRSVFRSVQSSRHLDFVSHVMLDCCLWYVERVYEEIPSGKGPSLVPFDLIGFDDQRS